MPLGHPNSQAKRDPKWRIELPLLIWLLAVMPALSAGDSDNRRISGSPHKTQPLLSGACWRASDMPLKLWIQPDPVVGDSKSHYHAILFSALREWTQATGGRVSFMPVPIVCTPDLCINWSGLKGRNDEWECGLTKWGNYDRPIWIYVYPKPFPGEASVSEGRLRCVSLHEIGHALGLGHSANPADVMFATSTVFPQHLTAGDLKLFDELYPHLPKRNATELRQKQSAVRAFVDDQLKQDLTEGKTKVSDSPHNADAHAGLADTLCKLGQFDEAEAHYKKALKLDPKDQSASFGLRSIPIQRQMWSLVPELAK